MIGAYHGISTVSKLIEDYTWSEISHIAWHEGDLPRVERLIPGLLATLGRSVQDGRGPIVHEAWGGGVNWKSNVGQDHEAGTVVDLYAVSLDDVQHDDLLLWLNGQVGMPFDFEAIAGFVLRKDLHSVGKWFCSALDFAGLQAVGIKLFDRIPAYKVSPGSLITSPLLIPVGSIVTP